MCNTTSQKTGKPGAFPPTSLQYKQVWEQTQSSATPAILTSNRSPCLCRGSVSRESPSHGWVTSACCPRWYQQAPGSPLLCRLAPGVFSYLECVKYAETLSEKVIQAPRSKPTIKTLAHPGAHTNTLSCFRATLKNNR